VPRPPLEGARDAAVVEVEARPRASENACGDRAAGHARDAREGRQDPELVQAPHDAEVEEHRAVPAAREAQPDAVRLVATGAIRSFGERGV
jgi:hypothetical protein